MAQTYPPSQTKVISDVDLCAVSFDDTGVIRSYAYGLMVEVIYAIENPVSLTWYIVFFFRDLRESHSPGTQ